MNSRLVKNIPTNHMDQVAIWGDFVYSVDSVDIFSPSQEVLKHSSLFLFILQTYHFSRSVAYISLSLFSFSISKRRDSKHQKPKMYAFKWKKSYLFCVGVCGWWNKYFLTFYYELHKQMLQ